MSGPKSTVRALIGSVLLLLLAATAGAQYGPDCSTPRRAARTFIDNLAMVSGDPQAALACFDWAAAQIPVGERGALAAQLLAVLDARGLLVVYDDLPDEAAPEGIERVLLNPRLTSVWVERQGEQWLLPAAVIAAIPDLHAATFSVDVERAVSRLPSWLQGQVTANLAWWQVVGLGLSLLVAFLLQQLVTWLVATHGQRLLRGQGESADDTLLDRAARHIGTLAMAGALFQALPLLQLGVRFNLIASIALRVLAALAAVMLAYRLVDVVSDILARRAGRTASKLDDQLIPLVRKIMKVVVAVLGGIFVLQNLDVDVASLLAGATVGGLAFSFAAKDTVANLFGSISIFTDQPFQIGDWVVIDGKEGTVEEVGLRSTRIRTFYDSVVTIPNSTVANATVDNYGRRRRRRVTTNLKLVHATTPSQIEALCAGIRAYLPTHPAVLPEGSEIHFKGFGDEALEVLIYFFVDVPNWTEELACRHAVYLEVLRLTQELAIEVAAPYTTVRVVADGSAAPRS